MLDRSTQKEDIFFEISECSRRYRNIRVREGGANAIIGVHSEIDRFMNQKSQQASCKEGCSSCCHMNIGSNKDEMNLVLAYCAENKIEISRGALKKRTRDSSNKCVFLKNNRCVIYPVRFIVCRKYMVSTNPSLCAREKGMPKEVGILVHSLAEILTAGVLSVDTVFNIDSYILNQGVTHD
jgi:hypothetical protein